MEGLTRGIHWRFDEGTLGEGVGCPRVVLLLNTYPFRLGHIKLNDMSAGLDVSAGYGI